MTVCVCWVKKNELTGVFFHCEMASFMKPYIFMMLLELYIGIQIM